MKKNNQELGFYAGYLQMQKKQKKIEKVKQKYNISDNEKVVIEEKSLFERILIRIGIVLSSIFKVLFVFLLFILASIGTVVLLNSVLRNEFLNLLINNF